MEITQVSIYLGTIVLFYVIVLLSGIAVFYIVLKSKNLVFIKIKDKNNQFEYNERFKYGRKN